MDGLDSTDSENALPEFTPTELREMESLLKEVGEKSPSRDFCQELATRFSCSTDRTGKSAMKWEKVRSWFQDKQKELAAKVTKPKGERIAGLSGLLFEAQSSKDGGWFDVSSFLNFRILRTGTLEVRVRFAGFGKEEDEWVNVETGVRERSIPLESSECHWIHVGDLVICFRESDDDAIYCDAHIVKIHRRLHDVRSCRCIFVVRYEDNEAEEKVRLDRLCCRPK
ncbi:Protein SAWADEE HOMEODOMAIN like [Actinidia chinensis var. chinensis]|uniref:Protein SAWADEE HOMEODOMAIN like n=1 Tax=Actinidia chinensis var. chinensis TaxID=1590841 RepID=A0A2R6QFJ6_ACTCC|nr:Protein SAWADEE HOMEODOMAIN like [Actinidia chinensis var. chinensis]